MTAPAMSFYTRGKEHLQVFGFDSTSKDNALIDKKDAPFPLPTPKAVQWSPDGQALALVEPVQGVQVVTFPAGVSQDATLHTLAGAPKTTQSFIWSPKSSALVTVAPGSKACTEPNLHIWRRGAEGYELEASFLHPKLEKGARVFQWTSDEVLCARLLPDGSLHVLSGTDLSGPPLVELKLAKGMECFEFAPVSPRGNLRARVAVFVPDVRDDLQRVVGPAEAVIFELTGELGDLKAQEKAKSSVPSGQVAELMWNSTGSALIAHCQTEVDESGQSYYGGSKLVLLSSDGEFQKDLMEGEDGIPLTNITAVQAVAWSPARDEFIFIHGFQPSQASLFSWDERAKKVSLAKVLLEKAHRNTIRFNHFGSLVCLAGFGNLAGQVDFFGRSDEGDDEKCDFVRVSSCTANCTVAAEWAPDGRHFLTAVLAPRMRVDNGASIWNAITGTKVTGRDFEELYDTQWRPEPPGSLRFLDVSADEIEAATKECAKQGTAVGGVEKKQAYRPPKARGEGSGTTWAPSSVAAMMRGEVAAPDGDDRRKRQPRRVREEEPHPSPRPDEPPWAHTQQDHRDRGGSRESAQHAAGEGEQEMPSPERVSNPLQQQLQQQHQREQQQQRDQQQREQQQREQSLLQQQRAAQQREAAQAAQQAALQQQQQAAAQAALHQQQRERQQASQQPSPTRPPPPAEVPPPQQTKAMQVAEAARLAAAAGYPGQQQRLLAMQQQQAQQQAAYGRQTVMPSQQDARIQYYQQQAEHHRQVAQQQQQEQQRAQSARVAQQQQQAQQASLSQGHGLKTPCPQSGWQYVDPKGQTQGPFTLLEMQQWNSMGYFRPDLPMRCDSTDRFVPFVELFPHPLIPFQSYPKRPAPSGLAGLR